MVRVRPLLEHEVARGTSATLLSIQSQNVSLSAARGARASFNVDGAFGPETSQTQFFDACGIQPLVRAVLDGFHGAARRRTAVKQIDPMGGDSLAESW